MILLPTAYRGAIDAPPSDPHWSSVVLLVGNNNPPNDTTTLTDQSTAAHTFTRVSTPIFKTAQAPNGMTSSVEYIAAESDRWTSADSADWHFGSGDFTIEAWVRMTATANQAFVSQWNTSTSFILDVNESGQLRLVTSPNGAAVNYVKAAWAYSTNTWYHIAGVRNGDVGRIYVDGVQLTSAAITGSLFNSTEVLELGSLNAGLYDMGGFIGPMRITKGVCRYPSGTTFTPPTLPLPTS